MQNFFFGPWKIPPGEIFYNSKLSFGLVNLKPVVPGHVLVISRRVCPRFNDLTQDEVVDLFKSVQIISQQIESIYKAESLTITIQDGEQAGQSVPHVHCHILPRFKGDWFNNDDVYPEINQKESEMAKEIDSHKVNGPDVEKPSRTIEDMEKESSELRPHFSQYEDIWK